MDSDERATCVTCRWWAMSPERAKEAGILLEEQAPCRRRSPVLGDFQRRGAHLGVEALWPLVHGFDWCGDFEHEA